MIIRNHEDVTRAVLSEVERTEDPRLREILTAVVFHLHALVREVHLTEEEFRTACGFVAELGQRTNASHNEVVLLAGSLGVSTLVCLLNNGNGPDRETTANLLGPFWRADSPRTENGGTIVRSPTPGPRLVVTATVRDTDGLPVRDAEVDVWHSSPEGFYESQDPGQADMNLRGKFRTDEDGVIRFVTVKPAGYPIPVDGPVGRMLRAEGRHNMRPAHIHFLIHKPGYKTHISQVYSGDDPNLETDVQFGVTRALVGDYIRREDGDDAYSLDCTFTIDRGDSRLPPAPIQSKAQGARPELEILEPRRQH